MFKSILLAYDGSELAQKAAILTGNLARGLIPKSAIWIVTVVEPSHWDLGEPNLSQDIEQHASAGEDLIQEAAALVGAEVEIHRELLFGTAAESILKVAETRGCDLIVMGARGLGLLEMLLLGSQAQKVLSHAHCPVLVVK
jgi:nucleotide-binding universal stress UspA family protein